MRLVGEDKPISPAESAGDTTESDQTRWKKERKTPLIPRYLLLSAARTSAPPQGTAMIRWKPKSKLFTAT